MSLIIEEMIKSNSDAVRIFGRGGGRGLRLPDFREGEREID